MSGAPEPGTPAFFSARIGIRVEREQREGPHPNSFRHFMYIRRSSRNPLVSLRDWVTLYKGTPNEAIARQQCREWIEINGHLFK